VDATALNNELTVSGSNYVQVLGENGGVVTNINTINGEAFALPVQMSTVMMFI
jgi:hypothetical protein